MNSLQNWQTTITILDPDRQAFWERAIGTATLPIKSLSPIIVDLPGLPASPVFLLDLDAITPEMKLQIAIATAAKFGLDVTRVILDMESGFAPILATNSMIECTDLETILQSLA